MDRKVLGAQDVSRMCFTCGTQNVAGLHARFFELEGGDLLGVFEPRPEHQGYPERLHGGIASTLLDETIGRAVSVGEPNTWGVTLELTVRYRKPVPLDRPVRAICRVTKDAGRMYEGTGEIVLEDGQVAVEASGRYLRMPLERIADGDVATEILPDDRPRPDSVSL